MSSIFIDRYCSKCMDMRLNANCLNASVWSLNLKNIAKLNGVYARLVVSLIYFALAVVSRTKCSNKLYVW